MRLYKDQNKKKEKKRKMKGKKIINFATIKNLFFIFLDILKMIS